MLESTIFVCVSMCHMKKDGKKQTVWCLCVYMCVWRSVHVRPHVRSRGGASITTYIHPLHQYMHSMHCHTCIHTVQHRPRAGRGVMALPQVRREVQSSSRRKY